MHKKLRKQTGVSRMTVFNFCRLSYLQHQFPTSNLLNHSLNMSISFHSVPHLSWAVIRQGVFRPLWDQCKVDRLKKEWSEVSEGQVGDREWSQDGDECPHVTEEQQCQLAIFLLLLLLLLTQTQDVQMSAPVHNLGTIKKITILVKTMMFILV